MSEGLVHADSGDAVSSERSTNERIDWLDMEPEELARKIVKVSTSSYRRDVGIGCVDIENLVENLTAVFGSMRQYWSDDRGIESASGEEE